MFDSVSLISYNLTQLFSSHRTFIVCLCGSLADICWLMLTEFDIWEIFVALRHRKIDLINNTWQWEIFSSHVFRLCCKVLILLNALPNMWMLFCLIKLCKTFSFFFPPRRHRDESREVTFRRSWIFKQKNHRHGLRWLSASRYHSCFFSSSASTCCSEWLGSVRMLGPDATRAVDRVWYFSLDLSRSRRTRGNSLACAVFFSLVLWNSCFEKRKNGCACGITVWSTVACILGRGGWGERNFRVMWPEVSIGMEGRKVHSCFLFLMLLRKVLLPMHC